MASQPGVCKKGGENSKAKMMPLSEAVGGVQQQGDTGGCWGSWPAMDTRQSSEITTQKCERPRPATLRAEGTAVVFTKDLLTHHTCGPRTRGEHVAPRCRTRGGRGRPRPSTQRAETQPCCPRPHRVISITGSWGAAPTLPRALSTPAPGLGMEAPLCREGARVCDYVCANTHVCTRRCLLLA